ncbi:MAG: YafY family protein [Candidatus Zixiibacteriota bacterium]
MGMNKYDRMLHILNLLRTRRNLNAARLADECGVTERSIYRDIISLSEMNVPIYYDNGYKLASDNFLPALNFTADEYHLLRLALESSPLIKAGGYEEVFKSVKAKIDNCLSEQVRKETKFAPTTTHIENPLSGEREKGEKYYDVIEQAIAGCRRIKVDYESISSGRSARIIDPYFIVFRGHAFYFVGYCHTRKDFRTFRVDRVHNVEILSDIFIKNSDIRPQTYFEGSWSVFSGEPVTVKAVFSGTAARVVSSNKHHPDEMVEPLDDGRVRYATTVRGIEEIQRWLIGFGDQVEVLEPDNLRKSLARIGEYFRTLYK